MDRGAQPVPIRPAVRGLPALPDRAVAAAAEYPQAASLVGADRRIARCIRASVGPVAPRAVRFQLPLVEQAAHVGAHERFEPSVGIRGDRRLADDSSPTQAVPARPAAAAVLPTA